jgi:hypothetical protein
MAPSLHLSDAQIDDYWTGRLADADAERVELHYLECAQCRERAGAIEQLVDALRRERVPAARPLLSARAWQRLAATLAIVVVGAAWQWAREDRVSDAPSASVLVDRRGARSTLTVAIEPPTRGSAAAEVRVPDGVAIVVFDLDAREAGAAGTTFDVTLTGAGGRSIMRVQARSSDTGRVELPVHRSLLNSGPFQFEIARDGTTIAIPISIVGATQQP